VKGEKMIQAQNKNNGDMVRVLVADDHVLFKKITARIISDTDDMVIAREAKTEEDILASIDNGDIDILILETLLSGKSGYEILRKIKERRPLFPVLMISTYYEDIYERSAFTHGADGFVTTDNMLDELVRAIRTVMKGQKYFNFHSEKTLKEIEH
jgi:DNA-binding NarL/FixJ family response regulator